jgi:hypothetical protein
MNNKHTRRTSKPSHKLQRGQILVIVVFAIVGLVAFVGLVVDTGLVFIGYGRLRRATDAAALAAASQYRFNPDPNDLSKNAIEFLQLNDVYDPNAGTPSAIVKVCNDAYPAYHDPALCTTPVRRRLVKVDAQTTVRLAFLPVIGIRFITLHATATSEAASLDIVLAIDVSESMSFDAPEYTASRDPSICNQADAEGFSQCAPFADIQRAAYHFVTDKIADVSNVYDRVALIPFDRKAHGTGDAYDALLPLTNDWTVVENRIKALRVFDATGTGASAGPGGGQLNGACLGDDYPPAGVPCRSYPSDDDLQNYCYTAGVPDFSKLGNAQCWMRTGGGGPADEPDTPYIGPFVDAFGNHYERAYLDFACGAPAPGDRSICGTTNLGDAFRTTGKQFDPNQPGFRQESLWVVILLTDGLSNHSNSVDQPDGHLLYCPNGENHAGHWCSDDGAYSMFSRHCLASADDLYTSNTFLFNACMAAAGASSPFDSNGFDAANYDADDYARDMADFVALGQQALVYTIGFGDAMGHDDQSIPQGQPSEHSGSDWGEQLLKYAADVGDDGLVNDTSANNYFYAPNTAALTDIFTKIAERIATRLSH